MSNALAIAAVTSTLRFVLERALGGSQPGPVGSAKVTTLRPEQLSSGDAVGENAKGINVFLYRVTPNHAWNLTDLPTRRPDGALAQRPIAALDLHYLLTCYGDDDELDPQRLLGRAVLALAVTPVLSRDLIRTMIADYGQDTGTAFLLSSDIADQIELVKLSPAALAVEEMSRLWSVFGTPYLLSLTYSATVVLLEADVAPRTTLPVRRPVVGVSPISVPRIELIDSDPAGAALVTGSTLDLRGTGLRGPVTAIRVGPAELAIATDPPATPEHLRCVLGAAVPAGLHPVQVVHRSAPPTPGGPPQRVLARSNAVPILLRPTVTIHDITATEVTLTVTPALHPGQHATVTLGRLAGHEEPLSVAFGRDPLPPGSEPSPTIVLPRAGIPDGDWLVRLSVDGADSLPEFVGETYGEPALRLP